ASRIQSQEVQIFEEMQSAIREFMNTTVWTEDTYEAQEKIEMNLSIQLISMPAVGVFTATAQIQSSRPVYNTDYSTVILNYVDKEFNFTYQQGAALYYGENQYSSDLTSLLALYSHIVIGLDYDSFSLNGGQTYFDKAQNIFLTAQSGGGAIWQNQDDVNGKYSLMSDLINTQLAPFHQGMYDYHRLGLDKFTETPKESLTKVIQMLTEFQKVREVVTFSILLNSFFFAKSSELIRLFEGAEASQKSRALALLVQLDAKNRTTYESKLR
ncbi:DUF4835 family protein, partial [Cyclobacteriaceae bacterium]|nr:DUF4835 family protein [Cyclobacteriaceae bacterium]